MTEPARRRYDSPLRREQANATRDRIVDAACELLAASSIRDWQGITVRAVAERAGVSERTVFRHFGNERGLRDATMRRLEAEAGIDLESLALADLPKVIGRVVEEIAAHPLEPRGPLDPTLSEVNRRQHAGLLAAVGAVAEDWPEEDRVVAAAVLDVLWGVATYERLAADWGLDTDRAVAGISWVAGLVEEAVRAGRRPLAD
ncbi:MAG TPA: helix-turn-helix domain-containing protein [Acidimicrobiales bacterium]|nr:helix-turn-helix domain-containing protein [Acidimicrobiales bacterium]